MEVTAVPVALAADAPAQPQASAVRAFDDVSSGTSGVRTLRERWEDLTEAARERKPAAARLGGGGGW